MLEFHILGPVEVVDRGRAIPLGGPRQRALLAVLLLSRDQVVTSDRLIDELWGEHPPASAAKTLQGNVSHLRKAIGADVLLTQGRGYRLAVEAEQVDVERFIRLAAEARSALAGGDAATAHKRLAAALALWRGEALADVAFEPFAAQEIARLEELRLAALEDRIEADLALGHHRELIGELESLVIRHPHRERLCAQLMLALYRSGRHAEALEVYRRAREALADELGLEPNRALRALEQRILEHDRTLDEPPARPKVPPASGRRRWVPLFGGAMVLAAASAAAAVQLARGSAARVLPAPNSLAAIDVGTNRVTGWVTVGTDPGPVALGAGSLWVANVNDHTVSRVDPRTLEPEAVITVSGPPTAIASTAHGIWVATSRATAPSVDVSRIDPAFDHIATTVRVGNVVPGSSAAVTGGRTLWIAPYSGLVSRLDPASGHVERAFEPNAQPAGLAVGDGATWVTDSVADTVTSIDPSGLRTVIPVGHAPSAIAVGLGGVWVADTDDNTVVRIDPTTHLATPIQVGDAPTGIAIGAGSVWVTDRGDGTVTRIDPRSRKVIATIRVGGSPQAVVVAAGRAWVTVDAPTPPVASSNAGTLRVDSSTDFDSLDPALAWSPLSWQILYTTCAELLNYPDRNGAAGDTLVPEVAQSLPRVSNGGRTYTFMIRSGFRFSPPLDTAVTAQTFKYAIERTLNPRMQSPAANELDDVVGARAYVAGRATHVSGVVARGRTLTIELASPAPDLPSLLAQPFFCAVPTTTPIDPSGLAVIPSAGPYYVTSYTPGVGVVLHRNPNYHGDRPHRFARIEENVDTLPQHAMAQVQAGTADYAVNGEVDAGQATGLAARYGPQSRAARRGRQQYFVKSEDEVDLFALNTHRPLFAHARLRQAVSLAVNRRLLASFGDMGSPLSDQATSVYIPPGVPGYTGVTVDPLSPDLAKAREMAKPFAGQTAVFLTCDKQQCLEQARVLQDELAAIGLKLDVEALQPSLLYTKLATPGGQWDIGTYAWLADYPDPGDTLNNLLETPSVLPIFNDPAFRQRLAAASRLSGTRRYLAYAKLDTDLVRNGAPLIAWGNQSIHELFAARIGCQTYGLYGTDLAALCIRSDGVAEARR